MRRLLKVDDDIGLEDGLKPFVRKRSGLQFLHHLSLKSLWELTPEQSDLGNGAARELEKRHRARPLALPRDAIQGRKYLRAHCNGVASHRGLVGR
jgi:hypothetical protein